jgi:hypothetical protein
VLVQSNQISILSVYVITWLSFLLPQDNDKLYHIIVYIIDIWLDGTSTYHIYKDVTCHYNLLWEPQSCDNIDRNYRYLIGWNKSSNQISMISVYVVTWLRFPKKVVETCHIFKSMVSACSIQSNIYNFCLYCHVIVIKFVIVLWQHKTQSCDNIDR